MQQTLKRLAESFLSRLPMRAPTNGLLVLAYHNVVLPDEAGDGDRSLHMPLDSFEEQLRIVREESELVPLMSMANSSRQSRRNVCITFDDAYLRALQLALPLIRDVGATIFVAPGLLGCIPPWDARAIAGEWTAADRARFLHAGRGIADDPHTLDGPDALRIADLIQLRATVSGTAHTVGNHTMEHANLGALSPSEATDQLDRCTQWLASEFPQNTIPVAAYPYGISPPEPAVVYRRAGLDAAFLVSGGWLNNDRAIPRWALPRWNVPAGISADGFRARLRGWLSA